MERTPYTEVSLIAGDVKRLPPNQYGRVMDSWHAIRMFGGHWQEAPVEAQRYDGPNAYGGRCCFYYADIVALDLWNETALHGYNDSVRSPEEKWRG